MSTQPLIDYLEARDLFFKGNRAEAIAALERALGSQPGNLVIANSLEKLLDYRALPGEIVLKLISRESATRRPDG